MTARCPCCAQPVDLDGSDEALNLTPHELRVVSLLIRRAPGVVSYEDILGELYGARSGRWPDPDILKVIVSRLRPRVLGLGCAIVVQHGVGYRLAAASSASEAAALVDRATRDKPSRLPRAA